MDSCKKTSVVLDSVVSSVEFVNCQSVQMQVLTKVPTISIDKTDGCQIYLNAGSLDVSIVTAKSSEMNVLVPKADGDYVNYYYHSNCAIILTSSRVLSFRSNIQFQSNLERLTTARDWLPSSVTLLKNKITNLKIIIFKSSTSSSFSWSNRKMLHLLFLLVSPCLCINFCARLQYFGFLFPPYFLKLNFPFLRRHLHHTTISADFSHLFTYY